MFLFYIFLHQEVKRNQNITKIPLFGGSLQNLDLSVNPQPSKNAHTSFQTLNFRHFFCLFLLFLDIKINFIEFTSRCLFFKVVCYFIQAEKQRPVIHFFLTVLVSLREAARVIRSIIQGDFFLPERLQPFVIQNRQFSAVVTY